MKTLIKDGTVLDPANGVESRLNLLVEDGRIAAVTSSLPRADRVIDAADKLVLPGFIDIHMHEDPVGADGRIARGIFDCMLRMGVTAAAGGNCGINRCDPVEYLDLVDRDGAPVNVLLFAGHHYFREQAGALDKYAPITPEQAARLRSSLQRALDGGCAGISYGLRYVPGTSREEFLDTASCCTKSGKLLTAHIRGDALDVFSAVEEAAEAGRRFGIPVQISHIGSMAGFGQMAEVLRQIDEYRMNGLDIQCDCYPYCAFSTMVGSTTYDDGWLERYHCGYDALEFTEGKYKGRRATAETFAEMRRDFPQCLTVCYVMREEDVDMALTHPSVMLGSDGLLDQGQGHPRAAGAFPRFLSKYARTGKIGLYEAVAKMTALPARRLGLTQKGRLSVGADADIVLLRYTSIRDNASFQHPTLPPDGIDTVLIGGETALEGGRVVNRRLGRAIRL